MVAGIAYVADEGAGLQLIDISDPANPTLLGSYDTPGYAYDIAVSGSVAYVVGEYVGLQVIDVSDPLNPALLGSYDTSGSAFGVAVSGSIAYVADGGAGLQVIDVSDPAAPALIAAAATLQPSHDVALDPATGTAWLADEALLEGLDVGCLFAVELIFADGFETGDTSAWSSTAGRGD